MVLVTSSVSHEQLVTVLVPGSVSHEQLVPVLVVPGSVSHEQYITVFIVTSSVRVPGEIKRSRDLRGGRWSWTLTLIRPEETMSREVELG